MNLVFKPIISDENDIYTDENAAIINTEYIHFSEPVQNAIMNDSSFIRIIYSDGDASLFGLMIPMYFKGLLLTNMRNRVGDRRLTLSESIRLNDDPVITDIIKKRNRSRKLNRKRKADQQIAPDVTDLMLNISNSASSSELPSQIGRAHV